MNDRSRKPCVLSALLILVLVAGVALPSRNAAMTPLEMLRRTDEARGRADDGIEFDIEIESIEGGRRQERTLRVVSRSFNSLAEYLAPSSMKGQKLLMLDRNMWYVKPGLSKPVPVSPRQRLLGRAANGDIATTNYAGDYRIVNTSEDRVDNEACYIFELSAVDKKATYDRIRYWVSRHRLVGVKAEFYTVSGKMFKTASFEYRNSITVDGKTREFISRMVIADAVMKENVTTLNYRKATVKKVPDSRFNLNLLVR
jgi:hypothetical protein